MNGLKCSVKGSWGIVTIFSCYIDNGTLEKLSQMVSASPAGLLGISACNDGEQWKYFIAIATSQENPEFEEYTVPATTWAISPELARINLSKN